MSFILLEELEFEVENKTRPTAIMADHSENVTVLPPEENPDNSAPLMECINDYIDSKGYSKGLVDLALLTANANQLRNIMELNDDTLRIFNLILVSLSIFLQVSTKSKMKTIKAF